MPIVAETRLITLLELNEHLSREQYSKFPRQSTKSNQAVSEIQKLFTNSFDFVYKSFDKINVSKYLLSLIGGWIRVLETCRKALTLK